MKKIILAILLCSLAITATYASGNKDKKETTDIKVNIHLDNEGNLEVNGKTITDKDIEKWINDHLKNISIDITDADDKGTADPKNKKEKKGKTVELSVRIKDK